MDLACGTATHVTLQKEWPLLLDLSSPSPGGMVCGRGRGGPVTPIFREFLYTKNNNGEKMLSGPEILGDFPRAFVVPSSSERAFKAGKKPTKDPGKYTDNKAGTSLNKNKLVACTSTVPPIPFVPAIVTTVLRA